MRFPLLLAAVPLAACTFRAAASRRSRRRRRRPPRRISKFPTCRRRGAVVAAMLDLAEVGPTDYLIDLGSGDGRIAVMAAQRGARALGVDLDPDRVAEATNAARIAEVETRALFRRQDLFETPMREASVVTLYLLPRGQFAAAAAAADRIAARHPHRQPQLHDGRLAPRARRARSAPHASISGSCRPSAEGSWAFASDEGTMRRLELEQSFQDVSGHLDGAPLRDVSLSGRRLRFTVDLPGGARTFHALVEDAAILPDPAAPAGTPGGWRAVRAY